MRLSSSRLLRKPSSFMSTTASSGNSRQPTGWGVVLGFLLMMMWGMEMNVSLPLALAFVLTGLAATARLVLHAHTTQEVYIGLVVGILSQVIAYAIVG